MAAGCKPSSAHTRAGGTSARSRLHGAAILGIGIAAALGASYAQPAFAGVPQPPNIFNGALRLPGALGANNPSIAVDSAGATYIAGAEGAGAGCLLATYSHDGGTAHYLGRPVGGTGCAVTTGPTQQGSPRALASLADGPGELVLSRSTNSGKNFSSQVLPTMTSTGPGALTSDPQPGIAGLPTVFALVHDTTTGLPSLATSIDGGLTYVVAGSPINTTDIDPTLLQGAQPLAGNLVARRDDTGLKLYTVLATADSAADTTNLDRLYEAVGTVTPGLTPGATPSVAWHDVLVYQAPGAQLNRPLPVTSVDSAGHVYVAFSDGRHVYSKSDVDGTQWNASTAPIVVDTVSGIPGGLTSSLLPAVAAGGNGLVDLAWYGATGGNGTTADPHNSWGVYMAQSTDAGATWTAYSVTSQVIHQGALCATGDAACAGAQQSPPDPSVVPGLELAVDQLSGAAVLAYDDDSLVPGLPSLEATRQCGGLSAVSGLPLTNDCAAPQQPPSAGIGSTCPGPQLLDLPGDAIDNAASGSGANVLNLDITQEVLSQTVAGDLQAAIGVQFLSLQPGVADISSESWVLYWTYQKAAYYAEATITAGAQPTYAVGAVNKDGTLGAPHPTTGALIPDGGGSVVITIPAANVGNPTLGATFDNEYSVSYATYTTGAPTTGPVLVDRAPDAGFGAPAVVAECPPAADIPEAPVALMLPLGAGLGGAILLGLRRKRSRRSVKEGDEGGIPRGSADSPVSLEISR